MAKKYIVLFLTIIAASQIISCSSTPKGAVAIVAAKNEAAEYLKVGDNFLANTQYASALQYFGEALDKNLSVDNIEGVIIARNSLGKTYVLLKRFDDAHRELNDALFDSKANNLPKLEALCLSNIGELLYSEGKVDLALETLLSAIPLVVEKDEVFSVITSNIGIAYRAKGDFDNAVLYLEKAANINRKAKRFVESASNYYTLAGIKNSQDLVQEAIVLLEQALTADKQAENSIGISMDLLALAKLNKKIGNNEKALDYGRRTYNCYLSLNNVEKAEECLPLLIELSKATENTQLSERYEKLYKFLQERKKE